MVIFNVELHMLETRYEVRGKWTMSKVKEPLEATAYFSKEPTVQIKEPILLGIQVSSGAKTEYHRWGGLNNRKKNIYIFVHSSGAYKSKIKKLAGLVSSETALRACRWQPSLMSSPGFSSHLTDLVSLFFLIKRLDLLN